MFKKSLLVGAVALASFGVASADGFYAGAGVGGTSFHNNATSSVLSADSGNLGVIGSLLGGYTFNLSNQFNVGLEAFAGATSTKATASFTDSDGYSTSLETKARYNYGVRVLPGYQLTPDSELHLIAGYVRGNFKFTGSSTGDGVLTSETSTKNLNGFQTGLGSSTNLNKNVAVRGDIIYSGYQKHDAAAASSKINTLDGVVSAEYKFG